MKNKTLTRKMVALLVSVLMLFTIVPFKAFAAESEFAGGDGTKDNPYLISTKEHLNNVRNHVNSHFKMVSDIEFTNSDFMADGAFYNAGRGWAPIGDGTPSGFTGTFDGNNHSIKNLKILDPIPSTEWEQYNGIGLFANNFGTIKNISLIGADYKYKHGLSSYIAMGGIVGYNKDGKIDNCHFIDGYIYNSVGEDIGGIAGKSGGVISNCTNQSEIENRGGVATGGIGGIVGKSDYIITNCANAGKIYSTGNAYVGGIVGRRKYVSGGNQKKCTITYCFNSGDISVKSKSVCVGGIIGYADGNNSEIANCYNSGNIKGTVYRAPYSKNYNNHFVGGIVALNSKIKEKCYSIGEVFGEIVECDSTVNLSVGYITGDTLTGELYFAGDIYGADGKGGFGTAIKLTLEQMKDKQYLDKLDFENVWFIEAGDYPYPQLRSNPHISKKEPENESSSSVESKVPSSNNNLKKIDVSNANIYPAFSSKVTEYSVNVANDIAKLSITADAEDTKAKVTIDNPILRIEATTKITVTVVAENGSEKKYTISVYRNGAKANSNNLLREIKIDGFDINPQFNPDTTEYKLTVPYKTDKIKVSGLTSDEKATVKIVGGEKLAVGKENIVKLICKAENGNEKEYTIRVIRSAKKENDNNDNTSSDISSPISSSDEEENVSSNSSISPKPQNDKKTAGIWLIVGVVIVAMVVGATVTILVVKRKK